MIPYVGVISREDAELLKSLAENAERILEFGCGASTQIFAAYGKGTVDSVETGWNWIEKTKRNIARLGLPPKVRFHEYASFRPERYDLIFDDGADELRLAFAALTFPHLDVGGIMAFHDTRRTKPHGESRTSDVQNVCSILEWHSTEIDSVTMNANNSNTTLIRKRAPLPYVNWQVTEGRTDAQMGLG